MMFIQRLSLIISLLLVSIVVAADDSDNDKYKTIYCNATSNCPEDLPCCSQYGVCGTGMNCLGGCNPHFSFKKEACMAMPVCKNFTTEFKDTEVAKDINDYLGNPDDTDWVYSGFIADYDDSMILAMPNQSSGTVLSSTRYVWYGKVSATLKSSHLAGVVSAFILFSNSQDEIDYEFVGYNLESAETNYYYQAVLNYTNSFHANVSDTFENYHTFEIDWTPEQITWLIDGDAKRVLKKEDTYNETTKRYYYPQTPSRVQVSLWPAGAKTNAVGTVEWAGGNINWDSDDIKDYGYYYMFLKSIEVQCYDPPQGTLIEGDNAYVYNNSKLFDTEYIMITDDETELGSKDASGLDPDKDSSSSASSSSSLSSSSSSSKGSKTSSDSDSSSTGTSDDSTKTSGSLAASSASPTATGFVQFAGSSTSSVSHSNGASYESFSLFSIIVSVLMLFA